MRKFLFDRFDHFGPGLGLFVPRFKRVALGLAGVSPHGTDVDHAVAELDKSASHDRNAFDPRDVPQTKLGQLLIFLLADPLDERVGG